VIEKRIMSELPFMATENIMMDAVKKGGDRQELHEAIRTHSMEAAKQVKVEGKENDLIERIANDASFGLKLEDLNKILDPKNFIGRSAEQVTEFIAQDIQPILDANADDLGVHVELTV
ncbi:MAG: adenylosuccinate lyase, partial [Hyphomonadaceae bacterium]|nr:adenylosuccinate lyase [Clostridia bacterium]